MRDLLLSKKFLVFTGLIGVLYLVLATYLMNYSLVKDTIFGHYPLSYKWNLLTALLGGMWTAMSRLALATLVLTSFLTGANLVLVTQRISALKSSGKLRFVVGGSSLLGIVGSGCAACGLPVLALLGLSGSIAYLPFQGEELSWIAIILLTISLCLIIRNHLNEQACAIQVKIN